MYNQEDRDKISMEEFFLPFGGRLSKDNRGVRLARIEPSARNEEISIQNLSEEKGRKNSKNEV